MNTEITHSDFAKLAVTRHWTVESLAARFRGKIEVPREFFSRVLSGGRPTAPIPYRSVIEFYKEAQTATPAESSSHRLCACGCRQTVFDRQKWARPGCRKRVARQRVSNKQFRLR